MVGRLKLFELQPYLRLPRIERRAPVVGAREAEERPSVGMTSLQATCELATTFIRTIPTVQVQSSTGTANAGQMKRECHAGELW